MSESDSKEIAFLRAFILFRVRIAPIPSFFLSNSDKIGSESFDESNETVARITGKLFAVITIFLTKFVPDVRFCSITSK